jgi:hypothetical protein
MFPGLEVHRKCMPLNPNSTHAKVRVFLAGLESTVSPDFALLVSLWHKPSEHLTRDGIWLVGSPIANGYSGLVGYWVGHIRSHFASCQVSLRCFSKQLMRSVGVCKVVWSLLTEVSSTSSLFSISSRLHVAYFSLFECQMPGANHLPCCATSTYSSRRQMEARKHLENRGFYC